MLWHTVSTPLTWVSRSGACTASAGRPGRLSNQEYDPDQGRWRVQRAETAERRPPETRDRAAFSSPRPPGKTYGCSSTRKSAGLQNRSVRVRLLPPVQSPDFGRRPRSLRTPQWMADMPAPQARRRPRAPPCRSRPAVPGA